VFFQPFFWCQCFKKTELENSYWISSLKVQIDKAELPEDYLWLVMPEDRVTPPGFEKLSSALNIVGLLN
jgi:hypothetical protein